VCSSNGQGSRPGYRLMYWVVDAPEVRRNQGTPPAASRSIGCPPRRRPGEAPGPHERLGGVHRGRAGRQRGAIEARTRGCWCMTNKPRQRRIRRLDDRYQEAAPLGELPDMDDLWGRAAHMLLIQAATDFEERCDNGGHRVDGGRVAMSEALHAAIYLLKSDPRVNASMLAPLVELHRALCWIGTGDQMHPALMPPKTPRWARNARGRREHALLWRIFVTSDALMKLGVKRKDADSACLTTTKDAARRLKFGPWTLAQLKVIRARWKGDGKPWPRAPLALVCRPGQTIEDAKRGWLMGLEAHATALANEVSVYPDEVAD